MSVVVRRAAAADCAEMPEFRRRMEGGAFLAELRHEAFYRHKMLDAGVAFVARDGGRLVGVTSGSPRDVRIGGGTVRAADLGDLFVDPACRGGGLFRRLHDAVRDALAGEGVRFLTVRAGRGAAPLMRERFGYRTLFRIAECAAALTEDGLARLPLGRWPLVRRLLPRVRAGAPAGAPEVVEGPPEDLPPPEAFGGGGPAAGTVRDGARVRARYVDDPGPYRAVSVRRDGRTLGAAILLVYRRRGFLVDLWCAPEAEEADRDGLVLAAADSLRRDGADVVHFWRALEAGPGRDPLAESVRRAGLRVVRRRKAVLWRGIGEEPPDPPPPGDWLFRMGDTDGI